MRWYIMIYIYAYNYIHTFTYVYQVIYIYMYINIYIFIIYMYLWWYVPNKNNTSKEKWLLEPWHIKFPSIHMAPPAAAKGSKAGISTLGVEVRNIPVTKPTSRIPALDCNKMLGLNQTQAKIKNVDLKLLGIMYKYMVIIISHHYHCISWL